VVYTILKSIVDNTEKIQAAYKAFKAFDPKTAWKPEKVGGVPLHPGAEKFYKARHLKPLTPRQPGSPKRWEGFPSIPARKSSTRRWVGNRLRSPFQS
jgi:hypothetical protein